MIKVLFLPLNYGEVIQRGVYDAFEQAGCELQVFDYFAVYHNRRKNIRATRSELIKRASEFRPDLIHMQIQHTTIIDAGTIRELKRLLPNSIVTNWTGDVRNYVPKSFKNIAQIADYNLISSTGQLEMFKKQIKGRHVGYWQIGYDPKLYHPSYEPPLNFDYDIVFIANNNVKEGYPGRPEREKVCRLLRKAFDRRFGLFGSGWPRNFRSSGSVDQKRVAKFYHKSCCLLSVSHYNNLSHYFSDRLLMCLASGRPTISLKFPNWQSYFTNNCDLVIANSIEDIVTKTKHMLQNPDLANYIGKSGAEKVFAEHTYLSRIKELLDMVGLSGRI